MALYGENLPNIPSYNYLEDAARRSYRAEDWAREDALTARTEQKSIEEQVRSMELAAIAAGIPLPYAENAPAPLKLQLLEDTFAKQQYKGTQDAAISAERQSYADRVAAFEASKAAPPVTTPAPTTQMRVPGTGVPFVGTDFSARGTASKSAPTPSAISEITPKTPSSSVSVLEEQVRTLGGSPEQLYSNTAMFPSTMSKTDKLKTLSDWTKKELSTAKQQEKWVDSLITGMNSLIGQTYTMASGQKYTIDTAPEFIKKLEDQGITLSNDQKVAIYGKNWKSIAAQKQLPGVNELTTEQPTAGWQKPKPFTLSPEQTRFGEQGETIAKGGEKLPTPSYKPVEDPNSSTGWSWADITTGQIKQTGAPAPSTAGEKPKRPITEEEQLAFAKKMADATRAPTKPKELKPLLTFNEFVGQLQLDLTTPEGIDDAIKQYNEFKATSTGMTGTTDYSSMAEDELFKAVKSGDIQARQEAIKRGYLTK